jgi:hypothetical protein
MPGRGPLRFNALPRDDELKLGGVPEGVTYSRDSKYVYVGDFADKMLHIIRAGPKACRRPAA